jgi:hypothetical protein
MAIPPPQCSARRKTTLSDRFWAWYYGYTKQYGKERGIEYLTRCWHYEGHAKYNPDRPDLQAHESRTRHKWST